MYPVVVKTGADLREARRLLGLSAEGLAAMVRIEDGRTVRRWESGDSEVPGPVRVILEAAMDFLRQRHEIYRGLELLQSGKMSSGSMNLWAGSKDTTGEAIERHIAAATSIDQALAILTRQPPIDGTPSKQVHWYDLKRIAPLYIPNLEDGWSLPGELSPEAALIYFEKDVGFSFQLELCVLDDPRAEFRLDRRIVQRTPSGASWRIRAGDLVETFYVKRVIPS